MTRRYAPDHGPEEVTPEREVRLYDLMLSRGDVLAAHAWQHIAERPHPSCPRDERRETAREGL